MCVLRVEGRSPNVVAVLTEPFSRNVPESETRAHFLSFSPSRAKFGFPPQTCVTTYVVRMPVMVLSTSNTPQHYLMGGVLARELGERSVQRDRGNFTKSQNPMQKFFEDQTSNVVFQAFWRRSSFVTSPAKFEFILRVPPKKLV